MNITYTCIESYNLYVYEEIYKLCIIYRPTYIMSVNMAKAVAYCAINTVQQMES